MQNAHTTRSGWLAPPEKPGLLHSQIDRFAECNRKSGGTRQCKNSVQVERNRVARCNAYPCRGAIHRALIDSDSCNEKKPALSLPKGPLYPQSTKTSPR